MNDTLCILARPDDQTLAFLSSFQAWMLRQGLPLSLPALPPQLLLAAYPAAREADVLRFTGSVASRTRGFAFSYSHVGIAPDGGTLFLAPEVNRPLLSLREQLVQTRGCAVHTPLLCGDGGVIAQAVPWAVSNLRPFDARITALEVRSGATGELLGSFPV